MKARRLVLVSMAMRTGVRRLLQLQRRRPQLLPTGGQECAARALATGVLTRRRCVRRTHPSAVGLVASMLPTGEAAAAQVRRHARK